MTGFGMKSSSSAKQLVAAGLLRRLGLKGAKLAMVLCVSGTVCAQQSPADLTNKSLEELMSIEVTSVSKREEKLFQTGAAIFVITQEDIRRSGLTSIPELLRMVPGVDVARIDGTKWALSARGFNARFANKLLILIDGRSVYSQETSGVYWEALDLLLEHVERIEVIRGPGGTLWGANAVNGVINIITKHSKETQGGLVTAISGSEDRGAASIAYGGKVGDKTYYRVYAKYAKRTGMVDVLGNDAHDGQQTWRGGFRIDSQRSDRDSLMLQGEVYDNHLRETPLAVLPAAPFAPFVSRPGEFTGGDLLGRWNRVISDHSDMALQFSFDRAVRQVWDIGERTDTLDLDFQHHLTFGGRQDIVWGLGYRVVSDATNTDSTTPVRYKPKGQTAQLFSAFVHDEFTLVKNRLNLAAGTKLEHNDYSGFEAQPSVRLIWTPAANQTVWGAISHAVRTPARNSTGIRVNLAGLPGPGGTPIILALFGDPAFRSESLNAYEIGYRAQPGRRFSLDIATFMNRYDHLQTREPHAPFFETDPLPPHLVIPLRWENLSRGETFGAETLASVELTSRWKIRAGYSYLRLVIHPDAQSRDAQIRRAEGSDPRHQFQIQSYVSLPRNLDFDAAVYHVSSLPSQGVPHYTRLDLRFGWRLTEGIDVSVGGRNLLDDRHREIQGFDMGVVTSQPKRSVYGKLSWRF